MFTYLVQFMTLESGTVLTMDRPGPGHDTGQCHHVRHRDVFLLQPKKNSSLIKICIMIVIWDENEMFGTSIGAKEYCMDLCVFVFQFAFLTGFLSMTT